MISLKTHVWCQYYKRYVSIVPGYLNITAVFYKSVVTLFLNILFLLHTLHALTLVITFSYAYTSI